MMQNMKGCVGMDTREFFTLSVSAVVLLTALIYWAIQVIGVLEMLEMAYG